MNIKGWQTLWFPELKSEKLQISRAQLCSTLVFLANCYKQLKQYKNKIVHGAEDLKQAHFSKFEKTVDILYLEENICK